MPQSFPVKAPISDIDALRTPGTAASASWVCSKSDVRPRRVVAAERRIDRERQQALDREPGIDSAQVEQAPREEAGAGEEQHRQRDLADDKRPANPRLAAAADDAAGFVLEGRDDGRPRGRQRGTDAEEQAR